MKDDLISRQVATSIPILPKEHRKIFKSIDDAFETGWNEALSCVNMLPSAQPTTNCSEIPNGSDDTISRRAAIDALWKALYEYEDETEKQFLESEELDVGEWIGHRIFVQNMNDIDRQTILNLPSAQPEIIRCKECKYHTYDNIYGFHWCNRMLGTFRVGLEDYCSFAKRREDG